MIDLIIEILRGSKDRNMAKACLIHGEVTGINFKSRESRVMAQQLMFTENQANAILDMRLYKLIGLEVQALIKEHEETVSNIFRYEDILARHDSMAQVISNELDTIKKEFGHPRKTVIDNCEEAVVEEVKMEEMDIMFLMDRFGYTKTIDLPTYERNKETADTENKYIVKCKNTGRICIFTNTGQLHTIRATDIPFGKFRDKGIPIDNVSNFSSDKEQIIAIASQTDLNLFRMIFVTRKSMMKIVDGGEFDVMKKTVASTKLGDDDEIVSVAVIHEQTHIILRSMEGYFLRFSMDEIPEKKKGAIGVRGMKLSANDRVEEVYFCQNAVESIIEYKDKKISLNQIKLGKRDSRGIKIRT